MKISVQARSSHLLEHGSGYCYFGGFLQCLTVWAAWNNSFDACWSLWALEVNRLEVNLLQRKTTCNWTVMKDVGESLRTGSYFYLIITSFSGQRFANFFHCTLCFCCWLKNSFYVVASQHFHNVRLPSVKVTVFKEEKRFGLSKYVIKSQHFPLSALSSSHHRIAKMVIKQKSRYLNNTPYLLHL